MRKKIICIPERFNINIYNQLLDYHITFVNSQIELRLRFGMMISSNTNLRLKIPPHLTQICILTKVVN